MDKANKKTKTLKVRIKDRHAAKLRRLSRAVNVVWNYINELSERSIKQRGVFLSAYDIHPYTTGAGKELGLHAHTVQKVAAEYVIRRRQFRKARLRWRKSYGARRSLGWVPINTGAARWKNGAIYFHGQLYQVWDSWNLENYTFRAASFNEDARGRWYFNVVVEIEVQLSEGRRAVGIDLGCKDAVTTSDGEKETGRWYRQFETKLKIAQRARNRKRVAALNAKIANKRKDTLHKLSRKLVDEKSAIFVGNVSSLKMAKTDHAKSALDAGWGMFKTMLDYKCDHAGVVFEEVNEAYSSQTCPSCEEIPDSSPKGRAGLGIREWSCSNCGVVHDRDVAAAQFILARGLARLAGGIHAL